jgi:hypothetical protein
MRCWLTVDGTTLIDDRFGSNAKSFKTIYNNQDQPTETQAYDAAGALLGRFVRTFDEKERITDVRVITDSLMSMFPAKELRADDASVRHHSRRDES